MIYKRLYIDSDVILDLLLKREPFYNHSLLMFIRSKGNGIMLCTSGLVIANVNYIASRSIGKGAAKEEVRKLRSRIDILTFDREAVDFALNSEFTDFEDAIQHHIAATNKCDPIITRNIKDYKNSTIPVLTTEQFLRTII